MTQPGGNRRIDRVLAAGYLDKLTEIPLDESARRCARTPSRRRPICPICGDCCRAGSTSCAPNWPVGAGGAEGGVADRPSAGHPRRRGWPESSPHGLGRHAATEPSRADHAPPARRGAGRRRRPVRSRPGHDDESLARVLEVLEREEATVSANRRAVQDVMDRARRRSPGATATVMPTWRTCCPASRAELCPSHFPVVAEVIRGGFVEGHHVGSVIALGS